MNLSDELMTVIQEVNSRGGKVYVIGGAVRDYYLCKEPKDLDIEVFNMAPDDLLNILCSCGEVDAVGKSFGVLKVRLSDGNDYDFSIPRRDNKAGKGHKGFIVEVDPSMTMKEAASRRDFTMNSMFYDPITDEIIDYFGGISDLNNLIIRHTSDAFREDALRVLRAMQFAARYNMCLADETAFVCAEMFEDYQNLSIERIWVEWEKMMLKGENLFAGMRVLLDTGWVRHYPELYDLIGCPQDRRWHPEGDVWTHTCYVMNYAAFISRRDNLSDNDRIVLMFAALCHDLGKPATTAFQADGSITSHGHDIEGVAPTTSFLTSIGCPQWIIERVAILVREHMAVTSWNSVSLKNVKRLAHRLDKVSLSLWAKLVEADYSGRPPLPAGIPKFIEEILEIADTAQVTEKKEPRILNGKHLISMGMKPGPMFRTILDQAYELQMDGYITNEDEALNWLSNSERNVQ